MVWTGMNYPYFFDGSVNSETFLQLLQELLVTLDEDERFEGRDIILHRTAFSLISAWRFVLSSTSASQDGSVEVAALLGPQGLRTLQR